MCVQRTNKRKEHFEGACYIGSLGTDITESQYEHRLQDQTRYTESQLYILKLSDYG